MGRLPCGLVLPLGGCACDAKEKPRKQEMPWGGRGNERKVGKWWRSPWSVACACAGGGFDTLVAAAALVVSGNSEEIFLPVSDEMRSGFQLISPSKVQTFVRRGSGCVACVAARPLVCLQLRCASGRRHAARVVWLRYWMAIRL